MKNLNIDSENTNISIDASQRVKIEFMGGSPSETLQSRAAVYTVMVPFSSFSKKLQTIHRSGGKITDISISHFQLDLPKSNLVVELDKDTMPILEEIPETIPANILEVAISTSKPEKAIVKTAAKSKKPKASTKASHDSSTQEKEPVVEIIPEPVAEIISEPVVEIIPEPVVEIIPEPVAEIIPEPVAEKIVKPKKPRTSTKTSHGFSKKELSAQEKESVVIAEPVALPETIVEVVPEIVVLPVDLEEAVAVSKVEAKIESPTPLAKSKKSKTSSKSGSGFNKPKSDT